ncbi:hypothetical protein LSAT2_022506 [Lamellibrachia satsuma]|nr:hypothetical protein LSAT2_022506 [Lamellibrachia satsuma]
MLPPLKLDAAVHEYVRNTFGQYQDADKDKELQQLLKILGTPPMFTTLRVNTLRDTRVNMREIIQTQIDKQYLERNRRAPTITDHPLLDDTIVIPNSGPMLIQQASVF